MPTLRTLLSLKISYEILKKSDTQKTRHVKLYICLAFCLPPTLEEYVSIQTNEQAHRDHGEMLIVTMRLSYG